MEDLILIVQAMLKVLKNFAIVIPLLIALSLLVRKLNKEEEESGKEGI